MNAAPTKMLAIERNRTATTGYLWALQTLFKAGWKTALLGLHLESGRQMARFVQLHLKSGGQSRAADRAAVGKCTAMPLSKEVVPHPMAADDRIVCVMIIV